MRVQVPPSLQILIFCIMLEEIRKLIDLEISANASDEQIVTCLKMIADFKNRFGYLPNDIEEWRVANL